MIFINDSKEKIGRCKKKSFHNGSIVTSKQITGKTTETDLINIDTRELWIQDSDQSTSTMSALEFFSTEFLKLSKSFTGMADRFRTDTPEKHIVESIQLSQVSVQHQLEQIKHNYNG